MHLFLYLFHMVWMKLTSAVEAAMTAIKLHISMAPATGSTIDLLRILTYDKNTPEYHSR